MLCLLFYIKFDKKWGICGDLCVGSAIFIKINKKHLYKCLRDKYVFPNFTLNYKNWGIFGD